MTDPYADLSRLPIEVADAYRAGMMRAVKVLQGRGVDAAIGRIEILADLLAREKGSKP